MNRREFLRLAGAAPLVAVAPDVLAALAQTPAPGVAGYWDRVLVLVELKGGNDGLNTVVPFGEAAYYQLRPRLAVARDQVLPLTERLGLHPALEPLRPVWDERDLAIVLGVGYPDPNRSHFRSIEIWETGSDSHEYLSEGWVARLFARHAPPRELAADGIVVGQDNAGPLAGSGIRTIAMQTPEQFVRQAQRLREVAARGTNPALAHLLRVQHDLRAAAQALQARIAEAPEPATTFPTHRFGQQMATAARLLASRTPVAAIKVSLGGFDTHSNQAGTHQRLLRELAEGLAAFRAEMRRAGLWDRVLVGTYSEFGRRVAENGSAGTDHGTAAPHFLLGGRVIGGFYGEQPPLDRLEGGDLRFAVDFRSLYTTFARRWWGVGDPFPGRSFPVLECLRA